MNETAISAIREYMDAYFFEPTPSWPIGNFTVRSHAQWAVNEILNRIIAEELRLPTYLTGREIISPIEIIEEFISEMDYFYEISGNDSARLIFAVARDTADEILCLFV